MANYSNKNIDFTGIKQPILLVGGKIGIDKYNVDENGNIVQNVPLINAIDIDWNNAKAEGIEPISKTEDLINLIKSIKNSIPSNIYDLSGSNNLLTQQDVEALKPELTGKSAYELAKETYEKLNNTPFPYQTVDSWVASLKGDQGLRGFPGANGQDGKSAYDIAKEYYQNNNLEFPYQNQNEWILDIISGNNTKEYTNEELSKLNTQLQNLIHNNVTTVKEENNDHLEVKLIQTPSIIQNDNGELETVFNQPYQYQITLKDIASKTELDNLKTKVDTLATTEFVDQIDERINTIIGGASEAFDTLKEFEDWINNLPETPTNIFNSIAQLNTEVTNLKGELKEEKPIDDGNGNIIYIEDYKTYDKSGERYAISLEEVNEKINNLLNTVSIAKDVQDGAQENLIEYITHKDQTFNINGENTLDHFINVEKPENSKTVLLGINQDLLSNLKNDIINKTVYQSKKYTDDKLSWKVN